MVWVSDAKDGAKYVALFNIGDDEKVVNLDWAWLGLKRAAVVRDLWMQKDLGVYKKHYQHSIPPHGSMLLKLSLQ